LQKILCEKQIRDNICIFVCVTFPRSSRILFEKVTLVSVIGTAAVLSYTNAARFSNDSAYSSVS